MLIKLKWDKISGLLFSIAAIIIMFAPYQNDSTLGNESLRNTIRLLIYLIVIINFFIVLIHLIKEKKLTMFSILATIPIIIAFLLYKFNVFNYHSSQIGILMLVLWILFCFSNKEIQKNTFIIFKYMWTAVALIGIICYFSYILNLFLPYSRVQYYFSINGINIEYINYGLCFLYREGEMVRLCGICNEPGYFGTFCALILCACGANLREKSNIIIFIAGILTFSIAFVVILSIYILLKSFKNWKVFILVLCLLITYIYVLPNIHSDNVSINNMLNRISLSSNGLEGDNRSNKELDYIMKKTMEMHPLIGMGYGYSNSHVNERSLSYKSYVVDFGIIGCLLIWGSLLWAALYKNMKNIDVVFFIIVFFLSIYQRPNIMTLPYEVLLFGGIIYIKEYSKIQQSKLNNKKEGNLL